jgi:hypothetical protein
VRVPTLAVNGSRETALLAWIAAVAGSVSGVLLAVLGLDALVGSPAGSAFGLVVLPVAAGVCWPLVTCFRRTRARG